MSEDGQDTIITDVDTNQESNQQANQSTGNDEQIQIATGIPTQRAMAMQNIVENLRTGGDEAAPMEDQDEPEETAETDVTPEQDVLTLKVDGQEMQVTRDKVMEAGTRALQKESTADKRLREAAAKEAALDARAKDLARMEEELITKRNLQTDIEPDEAGREFADAIFTDEDKVAKTITAITKKLNEVSNKVEQVQQVEVQKAQTEFQDAVKHYHGTYGDIASDPDMHTIMNSTLRRVAAENPTKSRREVVDMAAKHVYGKFNINKEGSPKQQPQNTRKQAKEKMPAPLRTASARVEPPPDTKQKTPAQVLDQMRNTRVARAY